MRLRIHLAGRFQHVEENHLGSRSAVGRYRNQHQLCFHDRKHESRDSAELHCLSSGMVVINFSLITWNIFTGQRSGHVISSVTSAWPANAKKLFTLTT